MGSCFSHVLCIREFRIPRSRLINFIYLAYLMHTVLMATVSVVQKLGLLLRRCLATGS